MIFLMTNSIISFSFYFGDNMLKIDLHVHTLWSKCSGMDLHTIFKVAKKRGLNGLAITDHNTTKALRPAKKLAKKYNLLLIPGVEIDTTHGHIAGLFVENTIFGPNTNEVLATIHELGGLSVATHPYDSFRKSYGMKGPKTKVDAIEVFNSRCVFSHFNAKSQSYAIRHHKLITAGSDAHFWFEIGNAYVETEGDTIDDFRQALEKRQVRIYGKKTFELTQPLGFFARKFRKIIKYPGIN